MTSLTIATYMYGNTSFPPDDVGAIDLDSLGEYSNLVSRFDGERFTIRIKPKGVSKCENGSDCPAAIIIDPKTGKINLMGPVNVESLFSNGKPIVNSQGHWIGPEINIKGDRGPKGEQGKQGVKGDKGDPGDACRINGPYIVCGKHKYPLASLVGPQGPKGDQGQQGPKGVVNSCKVIEKVENAASHPWTTVIAECPENTILTGGGCSTGIPSMDGNSIASSYPLDDRWVCEIDQKSLGYVNYKAYAICCS